MKPNMAHLSLLFAIGVSSLAAAPIYIATQNQSGVPLPGTFNQIGIVSATTGAISNIQTIHDSGGGDLQMFDIATDLAGDIWGVDFDPNVSPNQRLFRINPVDGLATLVATFSGLPVGANINGMDFNPATGLLFLSTNSFPNDPTQRLYSTDVSSCAGTCALTNVFSGSLPNGSAGDIVFRQGEIIYGAENGTLYRLVETAGVWSLAPSGVNTSNPVAQGTDNSFWGVTTKGLVYDGSKLYAGVIFHPLMPQLSTHGLLEIDPVTLQAVGAPIYITGATHTLAGLTLGATGVPEPAALLPTAAALLFLLHRAKRKVS